MVEKHDLTTDQRIRDALLSVRRGTAFWHRKVEELTDDQLDEPTLLSGWSRRHLIAHVGYNARAISRLVRWANTGIETPMYASPEARNHEIEFGATMPSRALRHLNHHAAVSLNVEWRDSPEQAWHHEVKTAQGRVVPLTETLWMRSREVWIHAVDLDNGARFSDLPRDFLITLIRDITQMWKKRGVAPNIQIHITDNPDTAVFDLSDHSPDNIEIFGSMSAIAAWLSGRTRGEDVDGSESVTLPRWL